MTSPGDVADAFDSPTIATPLEKSVSRRHPSVGFLSRLSLSLSSFFFPLSPVCIGMGGRRRWKICVHGGGYGRECRSSGKKLISRAGISMLYFIFWIVAGGVCTRQSGEMEKFQFNRARFKWNSSDTESLVVRVQRWIDTPRILAGIREFFS